MQFSDGVNLMIRFEWMRLWSGGDQKEDPGSQRSRRRSNDEAQDTQSPRSWMAETILTPSIDDQKDRQVNFKHDSSVKRIIQISMSWIKWQSNTIQHQVRSSLVMEMQKKSLPGDSSDKLNGSSDSSKAQRQQQRAVPTVGQSRQGNSFQQQQGFCPAKVFYLRDLPFQFVNGNRVHALFGLSPYHCVEDDTAKGRGGV